MKAIRIAPLVAILLAGASYAATTTVPITGNTVFTGTVQDAPCSISTGTGTGGLSQTVTLASTKVTAFTGVDTTAVPTNFSLSFTGCSGSNIPVNVTYGTAGQIANSTAFKLDAGASAAGVGFQLNDATGIVTPGAARSYTLTPAGGASSVPLTVAYRQLTSSITSGTATSTVAVTVVFP